MKRKRKGNKAKKKKKKKKEEKKKSIFAELERLENDRIIILKMRKLTYIM